MGKIGDGENTVKMDNSSQMFELFRRMYFRERLRHSSAILHCTYPVTY